MLHVTSELSESGIRAQRIKSRIDFEQNQQRIALIACAFQIGERLVFLVEPHMEYSSLIR